MIATRDRIWMEIDEDAIEFNIKAIKHSLNSDTIIMGVVKSNAYGHGLVKFSKSIIKNGVKLLAVANVKEAVLLRESNIKVPILILSHPISAGINELIKYELTQSVYTFEMARILSNKAAEFGKTVKVHLKIDTGMGRIGFLPYPDDILNIKRICSLPNLIIEGIYTHLSTNQIDDSSIQFDIFSKVCKEIEAEIGTVCYKHILNSSGIAKGFFSYFNYNFVRPGIIMYGLSPSYGMINNSLNLKPVMSLKTIIGFIKRVPKGTPIGYGKNYITSRETLIATIPSGFADGIPRSLANRGRVLVKGDYAPIIGNVCMNHFMIDVTDIPDTQLGDEVVLLGKQKKFTFSIEEWASLSKTINTELLCNLSLEIPRYYSNQKDKEGDRLKFAVYR